MLNKITVLENPSCLKSFSFSLLLDPFTDFPEHFNFIQLILRWITCSFEILSEKLAFDWLKLIPCACSTFDHCVTAVSMGLLEPITIGKTSPRSSSKLLRTVQVNNLLEDRKTVLRKRRKSSTWVDTITLYNILKCGTIILIMN